VPSPQEHVLPACTRIVSNSTQRTASNSIRLQHARRQRTTRPSNVQHRAFRSSSLALIAAGAFYAMHSQTHLNTPHRRARRVSAARLRRVVRQSDEGGIHHANTYKLSSVYSQALPVHVWRVLCAEKRSCLHGCMTWLARSPHQHATLSVVLPPPCTAARYTSCCFTVSRSAQGA
jgi:hypothetical protein